MTIKEVKSVFWYDKTTGDLYRHYNTLGRLKRGITLADVEGFNPIKSATVQFQGKRLQVCRVIWVYHYGEIPPGMRIIHKNGNKSDNRIKNLSLATHSRVIKSAGRTITQDKAFLEHCKKDIKSKVPGLYSSGNRQYIILPSGSRRYITDDNYDECMTYILQAQKTGAILLL